MSFDARDDPHQKPQLASDFQIWNTRGNIMYGLQGGGAAVIGLWAPGFVQAA